ncbi:MAG: aminomethyl-transferring glycine dehydrogenase subunit GcvPB [Promethearchaeota archaeon]
MDFIFDKHSPGRNAINFDFDPWLDDQRHDIPSSLLRDETEDLGIPDVPEIEITRHFTRLSCLNYGVDNGSYPLGSCTMKYNPRINEKIADLKFFRQLHPLQYLQSDSSCQGILQIFHELDAMLSILTGMGEFTLQPAAGAHGEFTGLLIIKKYMKMKGESLKKDKIIVPDTAHGTNPASATFCNFETLEIGSTPSGLIDLEQLAVALDPGDVAGIMLTNPNTLGLFEKNILAVTKMVHEAGGLCYYDGANLNGLAGICRPGDMGFDIIHLNLHKTFGTPHGGGGPGAGPVGVKSFLKELLPGPRILKVGSNYIVQDPPKNSTGNIKAFHGNVSVLIKAYCYLKSLGFQGIRRSTCIAVLNANYLKKNLEEFMKIPYNSSNCYHEFVASDENFPNEVSTEDFAKRILDFGMYAPTIYFPLIVHGALMIEPTETESLKRLDGIVEVFKEIWKEAENNPEILKTAPHQTPVGRLDQVGAARDPILTYKQFNEKIRRIKAS